MSRSMQSEGARWFRRKIRTIAQRVTRTQPVEAGQTLQPALPFENRSVKRPSGRMQSAGFVGLAAFAFLGAAAVVLFAAYDRGPFSVLHTPERPVMSAEQAAAAAETRRDAVVDAIESNLTRKGDYQRWLDSMTTSFGRQAMGFQSALNVTIRMGSGLASADRTALREAEAGVEKTRTLLRARLADEDLQGAQVDDGLAKAEGILASIVAGSKSELSAKPLADLTNRLAGVRTLLADITHVKAELDAGHANLLADVSRSLEMPSEEDQADATAFGPRLPVWPVTMWFLAVAALVTATTAAFHARHFRRRIQQPLEAMRDVFRAVESGDQSSRINVSASGLMGEVQASLNDMLDTLQLKVVSRVEHERTVSNLVETHEQTTRRERLAAADELAAGVVADLDERVASAVGFAEMARRHIGSPRLEHDLGALIDQLTEVGRVMRLLTHAPAREEMTLVYLNALATEVADIARQHVWPKIDVSLRMAEGDHVVKGDAGRIRQAILNLVSNARAAMPGGGQLFIEVGRLQSAAASDGSLEMTAQPDSLVLRVRDTGRGIPQAQLRTLFQPFDSTNPAAGAGLGLPQVAGIMAQHGGGVRIESQEGLGTTVSLLFPCATALTEEGSMEELALAS